jgi:hypothetical protein
MRGVSGQMQNLSLQTGPPDYPQQYQMDFGPPGAIELPSQGYPESIPERAELPSGSIRDGSDDTPTEAPREFLPPTSNNPHMDYNAMDYNTKFIGRSEMYNNGGQNGTNNNQHEYVPYSDPSAAPLPPVLQPGVPDNQPAQPHYSDKQYSNAAEQHPQYHAYSGDWDHDRGADSWYTEDQETPQAPTGGGLRITNRDSTSTSNDEWAQDAIMHMNFAGSGPDEMRRLN